MPIANAHMTLEPHISHNRMKKICEFLSFANKSETMSGSDAHVRIWIYSETKTSSCIRNAAFSNSGCMADGRVPENAHANARFVFLHLSTYWKFLSCSETMAKISFEKFMSWFSFVLFLAPKAVSIFYSLLIRMCDVYWRSGLLASQRERCTHR